MIVGLKLGIAYAFFLRFACKGVARCMLPESMMAGLDGLVGACHRVCRRTLLLALLGLTALGTLRPPDHACSSYELMDPQDGSIHSMAVLLVMLSCSRMTEFLMTVCTLVAISGSSAAVVMLSATTAFICIGDGKGTRLAFYLPVLLMCTVYSTVCNEPAHPERTHGTTLCAVFICFYYTIIVAGMFFHRLLHVQRGRPHLPNGHAPSHAYYPRIRYPPRECDCGCTSP